MGNLSGYDASGGPTMDDRSALPPGEYVATIVKSEKRPSRANPQNEMISLEFSVHEGEHEGRRFWTNLNLWNTNSQAVEIAQRELNSICHAIGKLRVDDSEDLHGIPMRVKLGFRKNSTDETEPKSYAPLNAAPAASAPASGGGGSSAPWKRSA